MPSLRIRSPWLTLLFAALLLAIAPGAALAHSELETSDPADGATVEGTPNEIVGTFTAPLADGSSLTLRDAAGTEIATAAFDGTDPLRISIDPPTLEPGTYTVQWAAIADDGHAEVERGTFAFTVVAAPTASPTPEPTASSSAEASPTPGASPTEAPAPSAAPSPSPDPGNAAAGIGDVAIPIVVGLAFVVGFGAYLLRRRSAGG